MNIKIAEVLLADFARTEADRGLVFKTVHETLDAPRLLYNEILARMQQAA
jgi:hypothetical protein